MSKQAQASKTNQTSDVKSPDFESREAVVSQLPNYFKCKDKPSETFLPCFKGVITDNEMDRIKAKITRLEQEQELVSVLGAKRLETLHKVPECLKNGGYEGMGDDLQKLLNQHEVTNPQ